MGKVRRPAGTDYFYRKDILTSREYRLYKKKEGGRLTPYERAARLANKLIKVTPSKKGELEGAIKFTGLRITPGSVSSLFICTIILFLILSVPLFINGVLTRTTNFLFGGLGVIILGLMVGYYLRRYPINLVKELRIKASSQVVLAVLYMVVSMRVSPNLERALRFAAANISGPLAWDMRRLVWDIELGIYYSADQAIEGYIVKWKPENEEFAEALRLIKDSQTQLPDKAQRILDEALTIVLEGTKTRMKHYSQDLRMPVMVIHMMGIVLPVLGTIMAPLAAVFISDLVRPEHFIIGYDIVLPIVIMWFITTTLRKRPVTFSEVDISRHPNLPRKGTFVVGKRHIPVLPFSIIILAMFVTPPLLYFSQHQDVFFPQVNEEGTYVAVNDPEPLVSLVMSMLVIIGIGVSAGLYCLLSSAQKLGIQRNVQKIEGEFELALFTLGNRISGGTPTEVAIEKSLDDIKDLKIAGLFRRTLRNITTLGMTFEQAVFHPQYGSIRYYPSKLVRNILYAVIDTARKGLVYASEGMLRISRYLQNIRETQEYIRDILSETVSSMKFQAYFLTPIITGLIVAMADVIILVLSRLGTFLEGFGFTESIGVNFAAIAIGAPSITPSLFQLIVGIYLLEVLAILAIFLTKIGSGENRIEQNYNIGKMLIVGVMIYAVVAVFASALFGDLIKESLAGLGI